MNPPVPKETRAWPGLPRTLRALLKFLGTALLAGFSGAMFTGMIAHALGVSVLIASTVSGVLAAIVVALVIARHGYRD